MKLLGSGKDCQGEPKRGGNERLGKEEGSECRVCSPQAEIAALLSLGENPFILLLGRRVGIGWRN